MIVKDSTGKVIRKGQRINIERTCPHGVWFTAKNAIVKDIGFLGVINLESGWWISPYSWSKDIITIC